MKISYVFGIVLLVGLGIGAVVLATEVVQRGNAGPSSHASTLPNEAASPSDQASVPEAANVGDKDVLQRRVNRFVQLYYSRPSSLYEGTLTEGRERLAERLDPYVTQSFVVGYLPPLDTPPDLWNKQTGADVLARVDASSVLGHFDDSDSAEVSLQVIITPVVDGVKQQRRTIDIALALVREDGEWRVDQLEELYL